jgi:hypothetical protein
MRKRLKPSVTVSGKRYTPSEVFKPALEISTPDVVRREDGACGFSGMTDAAAIAADGDYA